MGHDKVLLDDRRRPVFVAIAVTAAAMGLVGTIGVVMQLISFPAGMTITQGLILLVAVGYVKLAGLPLAEGLRLRRVRAGIIVRAAVLGVLGWFATMAITFLTVPMMEVMFGPPSAGIIFPGTEWLTTLHGVLLMLAVIAVLPGFCEEALFRGVVQGLLEGRGRFFGIILAAVLFALFHLNPWGLIAYLVLGVVLGVLAARINSILPAITFHMAINAIAVLANAWGTMESQVEIASSVVAILAVGSIAFVIALAEFVYATRDIIWQPPAVAVAPIVRRRLARAIGGSLTGLGTVVGTVIVAMILMVDVFYMRTDALEPEVRRGDRLIVWPDRRGTLELRPGDIVSYSHEGSYFVRRIVEADSERVTVEDSGELRVIPRVAVVGKVIYVLRPPNSD